ncbi:MAG: EamA family transporter [Saprospiraceae bacterium]|nr:EamA family transporter [Saprospiraceae bacterium]
MLSPKRLKEKGTGFLALLALGIVSIIWGTTWVVSKQGVMAMPALEMAGIRQIIGGSSYLIYYLSKRDNLPKISDLLPLLVLSILNFVLSNGLSTWGVKYISSGLASIIGSIFPLWIVIIGIITTKTKPPGTALFGIILGFIGICTIFYNHLADFINPDFRFGIFVSFLATWSWAFGTIYTKSHAKKFNPYFGLGIQMMFSGIILFFISSFDVHYLPLMDIPKVSWFAILYLVLFGSIIAFICYLYALQHLPTEQTSIYAYINPIVALFTGWLVLGESLSPTIITGCIITMSGVYLVNRTYIIKYSANK